MPYKLTNLKWLQLEDCLNRHGVVDDGGFLYRRGTPDGREKFHIHAFVKAGEACVTFTHLKTKSGNRRTQQEPDLAQHPLSDWRGLARDLDSSVRHAVQALEDCFRELGAQFVRS